MTHEKGGETGVPPIDQGKVAERFAWFSGVIDRQLDRFDALRRGAQQKATWTLATSTGFIALASFTKGNAISSTVRKMFGDIFYHENANLELLDYFAVGLAVMLITVYLRLLHQVVHVYFPRRVMYPYPLWGEEPDFPEDVEEDDARYKRFMEEGWEYAMVNYIMPDEMENYRAILEEYIPIYIRQTAAIKSLEKPVKRSFRLMLVIAYLSCALIFIA